MKNIIIRHATEKDFPAILDLIKELAAFENEQDKVINTVNQMKKEQDLFSCLVAETEKKEIIAIALYFFAYYTWIGKSLYLDDLVVKEKFRRQGIGTKLLRKLFEIAKKENCKRVRWQTLKWNKNAISLYTKAGAVIDNEWINCDFNEEAIKNFSL
ncbi:MAG TPA: GNAT family N-acetyltransferase [Patescibacteria group bacterium]|nr:GNAT family N-acetyltransferase [Patescibacteria group bacterium]